MSVTSSDCNCYYTEHYFVEKVKNKTLRLHLSYDGSDESIQDQLTEHYGLVNDNGDLDLTAEEFGVLKMILQTERERRLNLWGSHNHRKMLCSNRFSEEKRNIQAYHLKTINDNVKESWLTQSCMEALDFTKRSSSGDDPTLISAKELLAVAGGEEIVKGRVFALPILNEKSCKLLDNELCLFADTCKDIKGRPNTMNRNGVLLDEASMSAGVTNALLENVITPLARCLFSVAKQDNSESCGSNQKSFTENSNRDNDLTLCEHDDMNMVQCMCDTLDHHHAFTVNYRFDPSDDDSFSGKNNDHDRDLALHFDNSEVTMNILLNDEDDFDGGELSFEGPSKASPPSFGNMGNAKPVPFQHKLGWGVIHLGSELHRAMPIDKGDRRNLIIWCRSSTHRLNHGCPLCGQVDQLIKPVLHNYRNKST